MTTRRELLETMATSVAALLAMEPPVETPSPVPTGYRFKRPPNDAGGFILGWDENRDGDVVCWTDVFNGYVRKAGAAEWTPLLTASNMPVAEFDPMPKRAYAGKGIYAAAWAGTRCIYAIWRSRMYRLNAAGDGWAVTPTPLIDRQFKANSGACRRFNPTIAVHPADPDLAVAGSNGDGCFATRDGFDTFTTLDLPVPSADWSGTLGKYLCLFRYDTLFVHVFGMGLFRFPEGPFGPREFLGGPRNASCLKITPKGDIWIVHYRNGNAAQENAAGTMGERGVYRLRGGEWRHFLPGLYTDQVVVNPADERQIIVVDEDTATWRRSDDGGETWGTFPNEWRGDGEVAWLSNRSKAMYPAEIDFTTKGDLLIAEGVGIARAPWPEPGKRLEVTDWSRGIHELVSTCGISQEGQPNVLIGTMDKGVWRVTPDTGLDGEWSYCDKSGTINASAVTHIRAIDDAPGGYVAGLFHQSNGVPGFSTDWGATWTPFGLKPDGKPWLPGGDIAVSTRENILLLEGNNGGLWRTADGGQTWQSVDLGDGVQVMRQVNAYYVGRDCIDADSQRPGTFAMVMNNITDKAKAGFWLSRDGGVTWQQRYAGVLTAPDLKNPDPSQYWQAKLEAVPDRPGEWLYANCMEARDDDALLWSRDDGATWTALPARKLACWDFGKGVGDMPALWFYGWHGEAKGWFVTYDWFATVQMVARYPADSIESVGRGLCMIGDMNTVGRCAVGLASNGWVFAESEGPLA